MNWILRSFNQLTNDELYALLLLRSKVFVVEQNCVFLDMDNKDQKSYHLLGYQDKELTAYTRLVPPGGSYAEMSIGRVVTDPAYRMKGLGKELMEESIKEMYRVYGTQPIRIGAQLYLQRFYESFGFRQVSDVYMEDGIPHIEMLLS